MEQGVPVMLPLLNLHTLELDGKYLRPCYNTDDRLCVYGQLPASAAASVSGDDFIVQPLVSSMKFLRGSVDSMSRAVNFTNKDTNSYDYNPSLDVVLCPGVAVAETKASDPNATEIVQNWEDIPKEMAAEIVQQLLIPKDVDTGNVVIDYTESEVAEAIKISESYYMTSEAYLNSITENDSDGLGFEDSGMKGRSQMWKDTIGQYQESGDCEETYTNRLKWRIVRANNPETDVSLLNVEFNTTGDTERDVGCIRILALAIASHPDVCSLESRERVETQNKVIQWLLQGELEDERPFFDVGLNGTGQVLTVSDTGVDRDHCYFADPDAEPGSVSCC